MEPQADRVDFKRSIVKKPWGYEYLMYENGLVGVWRLFIRHGARTSLHCHPRKKTSIILLSGEAIISFLNDSVPLRSLSKLMIREGLFHSTTAISPEGIVVIETETPCEKTNLVRLDDEYGRQGEPYEGPEAILPLDDSCVQLNHPEEGQQFVYKLCDCVLSVEKHGDISGLRQRPPGEIIVVLEGGLLTPAGDRILSPGDVVSSSTLERLAETFAAPSGASLLTIRKEA